MAVIRSKLQEKYPSLTENDLAYVRDREEEVFDRVERRTGLKRERSSKQLVEGDRVFAGGLLSDWLSCV